VLFSQENVASYINSTFEPVWESVRPAPIVRIDFGNGVVVTRTLHGNIATYVCTAQGEVLDVVPGIYTPEGYLNRLNQCRLLATFVDQEGIMKRAERLRAYHQGQVESLQKNEEPAMLVLDMKANRGKALIESKLKAILVASKPPAVPVAGTAPARSADKPRLNSTKDLADWDLLAEDTRINEKIRRQQICKLLVDRGLVRPVDIMKPIYKDVLHADLDDPYLGLGETLFGSYPFAEEDRPK
jgi:hypothetical protein